VVQDWNPYKMKTTKALQNGYILQEWVKKKPTKISFRITDNPDEV
jgi:hypothetical protein